MFNHLYEILVFFIFQFSFSKKIIIYIFDYKLYNRFAALFEQTKRGSHRIELGFLKICSVFHKGSSQAFIFYFQLGVL